MLSECMETIAIHVGKEVSLRELLLQAGIGPEMMLLLCRAPHGSLTHPNLHKSRTLNGSSASAQA